jgi:Zn-finger nucleic acid-binding protein
MKCPRCETTALKAEQMRSLSIDACPDCQGIWVRRSDLEGLIGWQSDREDSRQPAREDSRRLDSHDDDDEFGERGNQGQQKGKRKGGWLQNIGDIFGGD